MVLLEIFVRDFWIASYLFSEDICILYSFCHSHSYTIILLIKYAHWRASNAFIPFFFLLTMLVPFLSVSTSIVGLLSWLIRKQYRRVQQRDIARRRIQPYQSSLLSPISIILEMPLHLVWEMRMWVLEMNISKGDLTSTI